MPLYILHGQDSYRSRQKLHDIIAQFRARAGSDANFHRFDAEDNDVRGLRTVASSQSLFASKKFVVVECAFSQSRAFDEVVACAKHAESDVHTVAVLWDGALDAAAKKRLAEIAPRAAKVQEFKPLSPVQMRAWIAKEAEVRNVRLLPQQKAALEQNGSDLWAVSNELDKCALAYDEGNSTSATRMHTVFELGDVFFTNPHAARISFARLLHQGEDAHGVLGYLGNHARTLCMLKMAEGGNASIGAAHKIHPFVIKKTAPIVRQLEANALRKWLMRFRDADYRIKTGRTSAHETLSDFTTVLRD